MPAVAEVPPPPVVSVAALVLEPECPLFELEAPVPELLIPPPDALAPESPISPVVPREPAVTPLLAVAPPVAALLPAPDSPLLEPEALVPELLVLPPDEPAPEPPTSPVVAPEPVASFIALPVLLEQAAKKTKPRGSCRRCMKSSSQVDESSPCRARKRRGQCGQWPEAKIDAQDSKRDGYGVRPFSRNALVPARNSSVAATRPK
jgi:hypothetical protein